ncbi:N-carbamoylputrescine amidase-like [Hibiscus syriacus]|uniref:N-carbamoylputrescine amidase-like n=1 Tax=Hibiscus syriacus TaxID=106335 RepID=A0A6A2YVZ9_HIBSY|nr:N-carbamoylputrescine amidase-like [Hibiscus syriacus]
MILSRFGGKLGAGGSSKGPADKRRPEDRVLKSSEGHFKNGVLDVKHLFQKSPGKDNDFDSHPVGKGKKRRGSGKKNGGKKKGGGGGRKRH